MTRHIHTRIVAALLATMLLVGAVAAPAAAGLPDPPNRPNNHGAKSGVGDVYDGSVFALRTKDATVTETKTWKIPCGTKGEVSVTVPKSEYGMSLTGPLGTAEMNGVQQAAGDLRPEKQGSKTDKKKFDLDPGKKKATLKHTVKYRHVDYKIFVQRQAAPAQNELIGYVHRKTLKETAWNLTSPCEGGGQPAVKPNDNPHHGPPPVNGRFPFQNPQLPVEPDAVEPQSTWRSTGEGVSGHADDDSEFTGSETADEATILLSERFRTVAVPRMAKRAIAAKRLNVEVDGGTVGVRTDSDGHPVSVRTTPYENPDGTVTVDDATLRELESAADPVATARRGIAQGRIEYSSSDPVGQAAFYTAEAGLRGASFARGVARGVGSFARGVASGL